MPSDDPVRAETRNLRRVQLLVDTACAYAATGALSPEQIPRFVEDVKAAVLRVFPDKGTVFELLYRPRLERAASYCPLPT
ncbi:MAG: hypothetical protein HYY13_13470 [Nitrospirae bacterium]|nr:hypothetical protein [Nitrospirota bacterium]